MSRNKFQPTSQPRGSNPGALFSETPQSVAFARNSRFLVRWTDDDRVHVFELEVGAEIHDAKVAGHRNEDTLRAMKNLARQHVGWAAMERKIVGSIIDSL